MNTGPDTLIWIYKTHTIKQAIEPLDWTFDVQKSDQ